MDEEPTVRSWRSPETAWSPDYLHPKSDSLDQMMSEFFIYVGSFFAAIELSRFKTRATDRLDYLRMTDRSATACPRWDTRQFLTPAEGGRRWHVTPTGTSCCTRSRRSWSMSTNR